MFACYTPCSEYKRGGKNLFFNSSLQSEICRFSVAAGSVSEDKVQQKLHKMFSHFWHRLAGRLKCKIKSRRCSLMSVFNV